MCEYSCCFHIELLVKREISAWQFLGNGVHLMLFEVFVGEENAFVNRPNGNRAVTRSHCPAFGS